MFQYSDKEMFFFFLQREKKRRRWWWCQTMKMIGIASNHCPDQRVVLPFSISDWRRYRAPEDRGHLWSLNKNTDRLPGEKWLRWRLLRPYERGKYHGRGGCDKDGFLTQERGQKRVTNRTLRAAHTSSWCNQQNKTKLRWMNGAFS